MRDNTYDMVGFQEVLKYGRKSGVQLGDYDIVSTATTRWTPAHKSRTCLTIPMAEPTPSSGANERLI